MPLPLAAIGLGISAIGSLAQVISGESRRVKAKRALESFQRQELKNITQGLRVSTLGAELQTQEAQRRFATSVDALRSGGVRGVVGGLGQQEMLQQSQQQQISADLDRQQMQIEQMAAQDEARIRQMIESRESSQIAGLGSEMAAGSRSVQAGLGGLASTGVAAGQISALGGFGDGMGKIKFSGSSMGSGDSFRSGLSASDVGAADALARSSAKSQFGFTSDIGSSMLSTETPSLMNTYVNTGQQFNYGLKPRG